MQIGISLLLGAAAGFVVGALLPQQPIDVVALVVAVVSLVVTGLMALQ